MRSIAATSARGIMAVAPQVGGRRESPRVRCAPPTARRRPRRPCTTRSAWRRSCAVRSPSCWWRTVRWYANRGVGRGARQGGGPAASNTQRNQARPHMTGHGLGPSTASASRRNPSTPLKSDSQAVLHGVSRVRPTSYLRGPGAYGNCAGRIGTGGPKRLPVNPMDTRYEGGIVTWRYTSDPRSAALCSLPEPRSFSAVPVQAAPTGRPPVHRTPMSPTGTPSAARRSLRPALSPAEGHVIFAYVAIAVYDSVMAVEGGYEPFAVDAARPPAPPPRRLSPPPHTASSPIICPLRRRRSSTRRTRRRWPRSRTARRRRTASPSARMSPPA